MPSPEGPESLLATAPVFCEQYSMDGDLCAQIRGKEPPTQGPVHDARIKAAALADPGPIFFSSDSFAAISVGAVMGVRAPRPPRAG